MQLMTQTVNTCLAYRYKSSFVSARCISSFTVRWQLYQDIHQGFLVTTTVTRRQCRFKNELIFYPQIFRHYKVFYFVPLHENYLETEYGTQRKIRNVNFKNFSSSVHVFSQDAEFGHSRCCFALRGRHNINQEFL